MPIYALDLNNTISNPSTDSGQSQWTHSHLKISQNLYKEINIAESTSAVKYNNIQELHLDILRILEGMRLLGPRNGSSYPTSYYEQLENESAELENVNRSLIRC